MKKWQCLSICNSAFASSKKENDIFVHIPYILSTDSIDPQCERYLYFRLVCYSYSYKVTWDREI